MRYTVPEFVIPSDRDQLLQSESGKYSVRNVYPMREIQDVLTGTYAALQDQGANFILENFDVFFSILVHGTNLKVQIHVQAFDRISKCLETFVHQLEKQFDRGKEPSAEDKPQLVSIANMLAYLLSSLIRHIESRIFEEGSEASKRKKVQNKSDLENKWYEQTDEALVLIYHWVRLPLEKLWSPPIADGSFVMSIADICYRILERCKNAKDKHVRESIFQILGTLVKRYNHSISCVVKVVQLVKMCDGMALHLAAGIVQLIEESQCTGIVKEILREVERATPEEGGTRNIGTFLEAIATSKPELMLPATSNLIDHLDNECYMMRNCVIGILGTVVQEVLTSEDLSADQKTKRDECLACLMDHILDINAYVRSKTLQVWQSLCTEGAVPLAIQNVLLEATIHRLDDKSAIVRKYGFQLLRTLLQCNPFAGEFNIEQLTLKLTEAKKKLKSLKHRCASISKPGSKIRAEIWISLVSALQEITSDISVEGHAKVEEGEVSDLDAAFESIRQLLFAENFQQALEMIMRLTSILPGGSHIDTMSAKHRQEYLLSLLHKIFMDSEEAGNATANRGGGDNDKREKEEVARAEAFAAQSKLTEYVQNCFTFGDCLEKAIPVAEERLFSVTASDAIEACTFLGLACQFKIKGAKKAVRKALRQVFSSDVSVCENVAEVYRQIYVGDDAAYKSDRQKAIAVVRSLSKILKGLEPGESPALAKLVVTWRAKEVLGPEVLRGMWERFSLKIPETSPEGSRAALVLLTMAATAEPAIITGNFDILVTVGLGPRAKTDLLLARDTCRAMLKAEVQSPDPLKCPSRLPNDHETFEKLLTLLTEKFSDLNERCYATFSTEAINAIYHLADQPDVLMKQFLDNVIQNFRSLNGESSQVTVTTRLLANLLHIVGHIAIREMIHLDMFVYRELKRRNTLIEMVKENRKGDASSLNIRERNRKSIRDNELDTPSSAGYMRRINKDLASEDNGEAALEGATADDADAEFIYNVLENEVISGAGLLAVFVPIVLDVCQHPEKYTDENLQIAAAQTLSKMMTVSSKFCKENLQLLITIMERSPYPSNRANILVGVTDLMNRFPNEVEPWTKHIYGRLRDESPLVRRTCVKMLSNLIMKEMIRVKGQVAELAVCLIDQEENIRQEITHFFNELANKGNALYNIMPDILSRLTYPDLNLPEDKFQHIIKFILGLLHKERQVDSIIEKVCVRFKLATTERQWRDLAYCLSLLKFNAKSIRRLADNLALMKDKIHHEPVLKVLEDIIEHSKKKPETKAACIELEEKLEKMLAGKDIENENPDAATNAMPPPPPPPVVASPAVIRQQTPRQRKSKRLNSKPMVE